ncbi:benzoyl-CoA reductase [Gordonia desulfuricans]|uniref:Benzoyl-CoA reductase n=1 Tax=Gordonia desulfuricans TaxID=89051 RepID=A0A7K3LT81_9ACTN|nr:MULTISPECIES: acyl-CoA dehydratase activase [Gordonia]EMP14680.1 benzoyl-CoA reductase [Gordonia sp. NB41Y]NDK91468.1 benzoyl-CoA reductase [Gordonia desulfuricans]WLP89046.1 acyl-CoA dehydratase activase [Gordonia sp. NB41Y]
MSWYVMGVDLGSTTAKAVIVDDAGEIAGSAVVQMGAVSRDAVAVAMDRARADAGVDASEIRRIVSTGYGRKLVPGADRSFTEITCHARGAAAMHPGVRLVIDIGGQDSKAITVGDDGLVERFAMNDRCASGTGRFFDVLARALEVDIDQIADLALSGTEGLEVSSMCATFAETEVISMLAQGLDKADIAASVHKAVAARTLGLVAQVGKDTPTVMTGGVAQNAAARHYIEKALRHPVQILTQPQIAGAYGAGLLARDEHLGAIARTEPQDTATRRFLAERKTEAAPRCQGCDGSLDHHHEPVPLTLEPRP